MWSYYGWVNCWFRSSVNIIYGRIMIGLSFSSVSKHRMWSYYDWVYCCFRSSVNIIYMVVLWLGLLSTIGSEKFKKIIKYFGTFLTLSLKLMQWYVTRYDKVTLSPLLLPARVTNRSHSTYGSSARSDSHRAVFCPNSVVSDWKY